MSNMFGRYRGIFEVFLWSCEILVGWGFVYFCMFYFYFIMDDFELFLFSSLRISFRFIIWL